MATLSERLGLHIEGWMQVPELVWLHAAAAQVASVVEIGSWKGRSTCALLTGCRGVVHAVDHWQGSVGEQDAHIEARLKDVHAEFAANVGHFGNLVEHRMSSAEAAREVAAAEMVFIDGGHEYDDVVQDIALWRGKATKILCGHDYDWDGVKRAVDECFGDVVSNPAGNIWAVAMDKDFAADAAHAFLFGEDTSGELARQLRAVEEDVARRLGTGWVLRRTASAAGEDEPQRPSHL
jgi:hypothetical protein